MGAKRLVLALRASDAAELTARELADFSCRLLCVPEAGSPGVDFRVSLVDGAALPTWTPPAPPDGEEDVLRLARPADHAGALFDAGGEPTSEPRGSLAYWLGILAGLVMRHGLSLVPLPTIRDGASRRRPTVYDTRGTLRILVGLVRRCQPAESGLSPETVVALLLWLNGYCTALPRDARPHKGKPGPYCKECRHAWKTHPCHGSCFAVDARGWKCGCGAKSSDVPVVGLRRLRKDYRERQRRGDPLAFPGLPVVECVEPGVADGASMRRLAKAIRNLVRGRDDEYRFVKPTPAART